MAYHLFYHPDVKKEDLPNIPRNVQDRIRKAIEKRLLTDPDNMTLLRNEVKGNVSREKF